MILALTRAAATAVAVLLLRRGDGHRRARAHEGRPRRGHDARRTAPCASSAASPSPRRRSASCAGRRHRPVRAWEGVRKATEFASYCMQGRIFDDMVFHGKPSEDCLYLNVWTAAKSAGEKRPVMVWIHGGGFNAGASDEPRHEGTPLARKGVVVVTINYRLGVFGFLAHPELTAESGRGASGNYALMDMLAALQWVHENVAAFGGDPGNVTIFGESAGSFAVSALVASPLARGPRPPGDRRERRVLRPQRAARGLAGREREEGRRTSARRSARFRSPHCARRPAEELLRAALKVQPWFAADVDGHVLPKSPEAVYAAGEQLKVPLLAGWNADEVRARCRPRRSSGRRRRASSSRLHEQFGRAADATPEGLPGRDRRRGRRVRRRTWPVTRSSSTRRGSGSTSTRRRAARPSTATASTGRSRWRPTRR